MADVSKMVGDRLTSSEQVLQAIEVQGRTVADAIAGRSRLPRDLVIGSVIGWLAAQLREAHEALRETDLAHASELTDDGAIRRQRDEAVASLRALLIAASSLVRGAHGAGLSESMGLEAALESRPDLLLTQARGIVRLLRGGTAPGAGTAGVRVDLAELSRSIELDASRLADALGAVRREEREAQSTLSRRDEALERWERVYTGVAEVFSGLCTLAGLDDLASKLKPTARRRAGVPDAPVSPTPRGT